MATLTLHDRPKTLLSQYSGLYLEKVPTYVIHIWDTGVSDTLGDLYKKREWVLSDLAFGTALTYCRLNSAAKFQQLASEIEEDCIMLSSPTQIALHPAYQEIIGMGNAILPLLIKRLTEFPTMWFWALEAIAGINPVRKDHRGSVPYMIQDWNSWARENGHA